MLLRSLGLFTALSAMAIMISPTCSTRLVVSFLNTPLIPAAAAGESAGTSRTKIPFSIIGIPLFFRFYNTWITFHIRNTHDSALYKSSFNNICN